MELTGETLSGLPPEAHSFDSYTSTRITPIQIDSELKALIPPISSEERSQLEANLIAEGCRDPLPLEQEPRLKEICDRLSKLRECSLDPFEVEILNLRLANCSTYAA